MLQCPQHPYFQHLNNTCARVALTHSINNMYYYVLKHNSNGHVSLFTGTDKKYQTFYYYYHHLRELYMEYCLDLTTHNCILYFCIDFMKTITTTTTTTVLTHFHLSHCNYQIKKSEEIQPGLEKKNSFSGVIVLCFHSSMHF